MPEPRTVTEAEFRKFRKFRTEFRARAREMAAGWSPPPDPLDVEAAIEAAIAVAGSSPPPDLATIEAAIADGIKAAQIATR